MSYSTSELSQALPSLKGVVSTCTNLGDVKLRKQFLCLIILAASICFDTALTSKALADSQPIPPVVGKAIIFGKLKSMHECNAGKLGSTMQLQVRDAGKWTTVATSKLRKNRALCPKQVAVFNWKVDVLGQLVETKCGVPIFLMQLRTFSPATKKVGNVWIMQEYSSQSDYSQMTSNVMADLVLGKCR